uniref:CARD domain-containing protein n=1 Tax=Amphimedon queenslandica TaxID=400682 RepID=A0A1X7SSD1_AMPQE
QQGEEGQEGQQQQGENEEGQEEQGEGAEVQGGDQPQVEEIQIQPEEGEDQSGELQEGGSQQGGQEQRESLEQKEERGGTQKQEGGHEEGEEDPVHTEEATPAAVACTESSSNINTDVQKNIKYAGLVYYEEKGVEDQVTFTAAKKLDALIQFIERKHSQAEIGPDISFCFKFPYDHIELNFTAPQDEPITGWMVKPHTKPSRLYQEAVDKFGDKEHCRPSSCLISVYGSPDAVPFLNYSVPLVGVVEPVTLNIHRARRNPPPPSTNPTTSSSSPNIVHESTPVSGASTFRSDIAHRVMTKCTGMIKERFDLNTLVDKLLEKRMINEREKKKVLDDRCGLTTDQRMDELLSLVKASIREDGEDFGLFLEIIKQENTRRADRLAQTLLDSYKRLL